MMEQTAYPTRPAKEILLAERGKGGMKQMRIKKWEPTETEQDWGKQLWGKTPATAKRVHKP